MIWNSSNYSSGDMMQMQQDALRRVREMQERANRSLAGPQGGQQRRNNSGQQRQQGQGRQQVAAPSQSRQQPQPAIQNHSHNSGGQRRQESISQPHPSAVPAAKPPGGETGILSALNLDQDKILILMMLFLLSREKADPELLIALGYLLL